MISWSPNISIIRHCNVVRMSIPIGCMLKDFKIETIHYDTQDINLILYHKDHFLCPKSHEIASHIHPSHEEIKRPIFLS